MWRRSALLAAVCALTACGTADRLTCQSDLDCVSGTRCVDLSDGQGESCVAEADIPDDLEEPIAPGPEGACEGYGAVNEPFVFTENEHIFPFAWSDARTFDGDFRRDFEVDLGQVPCTDDIAWSPFDNLLFVAIPAW